MHEDQAGLIERARRGELSAATELVDGFYAPVYAFLRRLAGTEADAADLTQKTFARVWTSTATFDGRSSLKSWLHGVAWHVCQDWRRGNHRLELRSSAWWEECPDAGKRPDLLAAEADLATTLYAAVERLKPEAREAVYVHYYQGLTLEETAGVLGIAVSTVKYRLRAAVEELRGQIADSPRAFSTLKTTRTP
jgi:RNA polymerase sigma-70 factor (ECF subfamily)